jgi:hypothetical protein
LKQRIITSQHAMLENWEEGVSDEWLVTREIWSKNLKYSVNDIYNFIGIHLRDILDRAQTFLIVGGHTILYLFTNGSYLL